LLQGCAAVTHPSDYSTLECVSNLDCPGDNRICRKSDGVCINLLTAECTSVLGDAKDDDAVILGATLALTGSNASVGIPEKNAIDLALLDLRTSANGLPPVPGSTKRRPLAVVVCDDAATTEVGKRSAEHLANTIKVPVILGPTWSGVAVTLLTTVTIPAQTLVIGTGTTAPDLTSLAKDGLFIRTITSMVGETRAMSSLVADIEARIRKQLPQEPVIKVALLHKGDSYGKGSAQVMLDTLSFNGRNALAPESQSSFLQANYGDSGNPTASPLKYPETVAAVLAQKPHVIVNIGTGEVFANVVGPVEQQWDAALPYRPYWVFPHNQFTKATTDFLVANDPPGRGLRQRFVGATPGSEDASYQQFKLNYPTVARDGTDPNSFGASNTYDSAYVAAFAIASLGATPVSGRTIAGAIPKLRSGTRIDVGVNDLNEGLSLVTQGQSIDLHGVSGPLDFDPATGDVLQEIQVWCIPLGSDGRPQSPKTSGYRFGLDGVGPVGTFDLVTRECGW
jgi:ABC-type branched-subunit amino acid transport system substrate-binding protein